MKFQNYKKTESFLTCFTRKTNWHHNTRNKQAATKKNISMVLKIVWKYKKYVASTSFTIFAQFKRVNPILL